MAPRVLWMALLALELAQRCGSVPAELKQQSDRGSPQAPAQKFQRAATVPLADAAAKGDLATLTELLRSGEHPIDQSAGFGMTPLHLASGRDQADAVALLLAHGASPTASDARGWAPLHLAASRGASKAAMELLQGGADAMAKDNDGNRASALAEQEGFVTLARALGRAEASVMRLSEEQSRSSIARTAASQLPAATLNVASTAAAANTSLKLHPGAQLYTAGSPYGGGSDSSSSPEAEIEAEVDAELLRQHVPRGDDDGAGANAEGASRPTGGTDRRIRRGSLPPPPSAAPTDLLLPSLSRSVTAHHNVIYHVGAQGSGDQGVSVEPTDHKQKLLGRIPSKIAKTRDKVAGWFSSPDAAQTHAKQFAAAKVEAAAERETKLKEASLKKNQANHGSTTEDASVADAEMIDSGSGNVGEVSLEEHGQETPDSEVHESGASAGAPDGNDSTQATPDSSDFDQRTRAKDRLKTMEDLMAVNPKNLHTLPRLSNDTVVKRQHYHAEDKPKHAPARHAELVAAALAAQEEAVSQGLPPTRGMQHPAIQKLLEKQKLADASPNYYGGEGGRPLGQDKLQPVRARSIRIVPFTRTSSFHARTTRHPRATNGFELLDSISASSVLSVSRHDHRRHAQYGWTSIGSESSVGLTG